MSMLYNADGAPGGIQVKEMYNTAKWGEMKFADDTAIVSTSKDEITHAMNALFSVTGQWGLSISDPKTKAMIESRTDSMVPELQFSCETVEW